MSNKIECPNCGYVLNNSEKKCKYCGSLNQNFVAVNSPAVAQRQIIQYNNQNNIPQNRNTVPQKKNNFSILIFVILLIFFWPAALIYVLLKAA